MKLIAQLLGGNTTDKKIRRKTLAQYQQEILLRQGREQFRKLVEIGLTIPVAYL